MSASAPDGTNAVNRRVSVSVRARGAERSAALAVLASDSKYRKYTQQVEKCLTTLENVQEWADFIAFLTKLLKTFQANTQYKEVPRKLIVAKRLAQCLNPALPAGVHQRALDVYAYILAIQGTEGLQRDLQLWSAGLLPFFEYASTSVRPPLLNIYETYYLPLKNGLRPITKAFILALMPGLEEEAGDFFDKVLSITDRIASSVTPVFFLQNVWLVMLTTPSARGSAVNYLARRFPKLDDFQDISEVVGRDLGLMIRAFAACLEDDNLLVRRGTLDLLVSNLKLDGKVLKNVQNDDMAVLMKAATNVVLRRDLSLNRRLYSWLLGADEAPEVQQRYFQSHALRLLCTTLKDEMFESRPDSFDSRPFKIFISLLDKWEIGQHVADLLIINALKALRRCESAVQQDGVSEDISMTASTVTEAVEPYVMWKQLFHFVHKEISDNAKILEAIPLLRFVIASIRTEDEEVDCVHLPIVFTAILDYIRALISVEPSRASTEVTRGALQLLLDIFPRIPVHAWPAPPTRFAKNKPNTSSLADGTPYARACSFYGVTIDERVPASADALSDSVTLVSAFEDLATLSATFARGIVTAGTGSTSVRECLMQAMTLLLKLVHKLEKQTTPLSIRWQPREWLAIILGCLDKKTTFALLDRVITLAVALAPSTVIEPRLAIDERSFVTKMIALLFDYLSPDLSPYHVRSVHLVWALEQSTTRRHVEATIAQLLSDTDSVVAQRYFDAFGVLWRLTDDLHIPGFRLKIPMLIVLDALNSEEPGLRRTAETWMRCCLRSYIRVLDPVLFDMMDPAIRRSAVSTTLIGRDVSGYVYDLPFDQRRLNYLLMTLLSLVRFGGQSFDKIARGTLLKRSLDPELVRRAQEASLAEGTYLDTLVGLLLRFLGSDPKPDIAIVMGPPNVVLQGTVIELLEVIVSRGEIDKRLLDSMETALVNKLFTVVQLGQLELQNKLLHALHTVIFAESALDERPFPTAEGDEPPPPTADDVAGSGAKVISPLLIQTILDALALSSNRPVLQHWLDFVSTATPHLQLPAAQLAVPLVECIGRQVRGLLADLERIASTRQTRTGDVRSKTTDTEFIMFLNAFERLLLISLAKFGDISLPLDGDTSTLERPALDSTSAGLLGLVSNVFSTDGATPAIDAPVVKLTGFWFIREAVQVLYITWQTTTSESEALHAEGEQDSFSLICSRSLSRCKRVLERLFRAQSMEVLESAVECWKRDPAQGTLFEVVDFLTQSAQNVVHMTCESIGTRIGPPEKNKKTPPNQNLTDAALFTFLEEYLRRLEGPIVIQVWGRCLSLAKDICSNAAVYKQQLYPMLRCITILAEKIAMTTALEDRRIRKDLQDIYVKLVDQCVLMSGRSVDQRPWMSRAAKEAISTNGRNSPAIRDTPFEEKNVSLTQLSESAGSSDIVELINSFLASNVLPLLRRILLDPDKVLSLCTNIIYYIVNPAMKSRVIRLFDIDDSVLDILREMSKLPAAAKAWRPPVADAFSDTKFFSMPPQLTHKWRPLVRALMDHDKAAFAELVAKISSTPSANIFTNREYEMQVCAQNFRRLTYVLYAGDKNTFLAQLPSVEEKVVDIVKNVTAPVVLREVYLCMRVLLCRLSAHTLASSWPVLVTEMLRVFEQAMSDPPADGSDDLQMILSVCKFVDLLLVLQTVEFQVHEWMFVTDTVDSVYRPDDWFPESLLDQLGEIIGDLPAQKGEAAVSAPASSFALHHDVEDAPTGDIPLSKNVRRPLLYDVQYIRSIRELAPFFSSVSIQAFEGVYASIGNTNVDWEAVEAGLLSELFETTA
ncbi:Dopey, N-terminal-domain-containing protein [Auriculariales sp. MPI-PUGE-AT-0066]|nr:Dopey, N-terminal-domain-containing protein [Auriculariales sp. MPI-PUGE-AT-0066]